MRMEEDCDNCIQHAKNQLPYYWGSSANSPDEIFSSAAGLAQAIRAGKITSAYVRYGPPNVISQILQFKLDAVRDLSDYEFERLALRMIVSTFADTYHSDPCSPRC